MHRSKLKVRRKMNYIVVAAIFIGYVFLVGFLFPRMGIQT